MLDPIGAQGGFLRGLPDLQNENHPGIDGSGMDRDSWITDSVQGLIWNLRERCKRYVWLKLGKTTVRNRYIHGRIRTPARKPSGMAGLNQPLNVCREHIESDTKSGLTVGSHPGFLNQNLTGGGRPQ
jgi:hypothetical protein